MKAVRDAKMKLEDVRVLVGGPHGNLQVDPSACDHVVLCAGGIGVTPMAAILEDRVRGAKSGAIRSGSKTTLVWTTRSPAEVAAFSYLFAAIARLDDDARSAFDVRVHLTGGAKADPETATYAAGVAAIATGRPDFEPSSRRQSKRVIGEEGGRLRVRPRGDERRRGGSGASSRVPRAPRDVRVLSADAASANASRRCVQSKHRLMMNMRRQEPEPHLSATEGRLLLLHGLVRTACNERFVRSSSNTRASHYRRAPRGENPPALGLWGHGSGHVRGPAGGGAMDLGTSRVVPSPTSLATAPPWQNGRGVERVAHPARARVSS